MQQSLKISTTLFHLPIQRNEENGEWNKISSYSLLQNNKKNDTIFIFYDLMQQHRHHYHQEREEKDLTEFFSPHSGKFREKARAEKKSGKRKLNMTC